MAEAGSSEPQTQAKVPDGQNGADRTNRGSSQSHNYSKDRQGNSSSSSKYRSKKDQLGRKEEVNVFDRKPKSKTIRSRQHAKEQEKLGSAFGEMRQSVHALEEDSKNDLKAREVIKGPVSTQQTSWHGKGNTKSQGNNQYQYGRGQRVDHYSSSKSRYARKHVNQTSISATSSQVPNLMAMDTQTPFESHGTVSDGIYVPKYKLENRAQGSQRKQFVSNDVVPNDESLASTHHRKGHLHSSREKSGYSNHLRGHANKKSPSCIGKLRANFQVFNLKSGGQSSVQAGVLIEQLTEEKYECMVCCEVIRCSKGIWSCSNCFHIFHLYCIKRWARSPASAIEDGEGKSCGWRCPACQFVERNVPNAYRCFCGKVEEPKWYPQDGITPHSCGELCLKKRIAKDCAHPCNQLCHPGPCPSCPVMITKDCSCGKTTTSVRCGNASDLTCSLTCGKTLNCGVHHCEEKCHAGTCEPCVALQEQSCYCGQNKTEAVCGTSFPTYIDGKAGYFSCGGVCSKKLDCGNHQCEKICHVDNCPGCELKPGVVVFCPCGKMRTAELLNGKERISCLDSIPTCGSTCDRFLPCAKYNDLTKGVSEHRCKKSCHHGDCSSCDGDSIVKCRCRATSKKTKCSELNLSDEPFMCERKCNKKFDCGRHRCSQKCCPGTEHNCTLICGKKLKCGKHKCMEPCHAGTCPPCLMAGFDEVFCPCGATVQEPPIPCGKLPPVCHRPCSRMHPCEHEVQHNCHYEEQCPPCTVLVSKLCMGEHKQRHNIPCHIESVSCGEQCGKPLQCGKHNCLKGCHRPPCLKEDENCKQPCVLARQSCGHLCGAPCHEGECPNIPCKSKVRIFCPCGRKSEDGVCLKGGDKMDAAKAYQRFTTKNLAEKIKGMQGGQSVDISGLMNLDERKSQLDCDSECARLQRNRALAEALGISRPETPEIVQYPHFLEEHGRANMKFVYLVENALDNLIKNVAKVQSQQLNHSFAPMNNKNRRFIHELATMYGCTSISYDQEPDRNTVVTANKESRCPRVKLSSQLQRQMNPQPPPPVPVLPEEGIGNVRFIERRQSPERDAVDYFADDF